MIGTERFQGSLQRRFCRRWPPRGTRRPTRYDALAGPKEWAFGSDAVQRRVVYRFRGLIGPGAADQIGAIIFGVEHSHGHHGLAAALGLLALIFAATSVFVQLQTSLNHAWNVKPDLEAKRNRSFFVKRLISFGMILAIAFLMLVSLLVSAGLAAAIQPGYQTLPPGSVTTLPAYVNAFL